MPREGFAIAKMAALGFLLLASVAPADEWVGGTLGKIHGTLNGGKGLATAFCIGTGTDGTSYWMTAGHAAEDEGVDATETQLQVCGPQNCYFSDATLVGVQNDNNADIAIYAARFDFRVKAFTIADKAPAAGQFVSLCGYPGGNLTRRNGKMLRKVGWSMYDIHAEVRPGMSGAPVVDSDGSVWGVAKGHQMQRQPDGRLVSTYIGIIIGPEAINAAINAIGGREVSRASNPSDARSDVRETSGYVVGDRGRRFTFGPGTDVVIQPQAGAVPAAGSNCPTLPLLEEFAAEVDGRFGALEGRVESAISVGQDAANQIPELKAALEAAKAQQPIPAEPDTPIVVSDEAPMFAAMPSSTSGQILWLVKWGLMGGVAYLLIAKVIKPLVVFLVHLLRDAVEYIVERIARRVRGDDEEPKSAVTVNNTNPVL